MAEHPKSLRDYVAEEIYTWFTQEMRAPFGEKNCRAVADSILKTIEHRLPELDDRAYLDQSKGRLDEWDSEMQAHAMGYNEAILEVKSILKGGVMSEGDDMKTFEIVDEWIIKDGKAYVLEAETGELVWVANYLYPATEEDRKLIKPAPKPPKGEK